MLDPHWVCMQTKIKVWFNATRPRTLTASVIPVVVASAYAAYNGVFRWEPALICLLFGLMMQVVSNYANEYYDFKKGADTAERQGPVRAVAAGLISPREMFVATYGLLAIAFLLGLTLLAYGGIWLIAVGVVVALAAVLYSASPFAFAYLGLGDVAVFLFYGVVAVNGTYYVQAQTLDWNIFVISCALGLIINNILLVSNYRDYEEDTKTGKKTLVVRFGRGYAQRQFIASYAVAFALVVYLWSRGLPIWILGSLVLIPFAWQLYQNMRNASELKEHLALLGRTSKMVLYFGVLSALGLLIAR